MDSAVGLVQAYLRINGYFTVSEYPIMESRGGFRSATDVDVLGFRFPRADRLIVGDPANTERDRSHAFDIDPRLEIPTDAADMIVGEVKEGEAEFNAAGRRPEVIASALARFGCCTVESATHQVESLVTTGRAATPHGHAIRLIAFGSTVGAAKRPYLRISLGHVTQYLEDWLERHWTVLRHTQLKDPVLSFLATLAKAHEADRVKATPGA